MDEESAMTNFDVVLEGGRVIDPASGTDGIRDLGVTDGRIVAVMAPGAVWTSTSRIDCRGRLVLPGLIDTHAHVYQHVTGRFGLEPDMCGVDSGVTTLVDQGGPSCMTLPGFRHYVVEPSASNVVAFLSAYLVGGLEGHYYPELYRPECVDVDATVRAAKDNADLVRGIKAHAEIGGFSRWGVDVMTLAAEIGRQTALPVYIHFGQLWPPAESGAAIDPDSVFAEVVNLLKPGDVLAHPFSRHPGGFVSVTGRLHPLVGEALARGAKVDVGHGSHFSFRVARLVLEAGIVPDTLGADMHGYNTRVPKPRGTPDAHPDPEMHMFFGAARFSLVRAMTSMVALGVPLERVVPMVTTHAAAMLGLSDSLGSLAPGRVADISVLDDLRGRWTLRDNEGTEVVAERLFAPAFCLRSGRRFDATAPILPEAEAA
jgi:dihydroorotase